MESIRSPSGVYQESIRSLSGVHQESIRSPSGVHQEYQDFIRTPDGLHQDAWLSVTYSIMDRLSRRNNRLPSMGLPGRDYSCRVVTNLQEYSMQR